MAQTSTGANTGAGTGAGTGDIDSTLSTIRDRLDKTAQQTRDHQTIVAEAEQRLAALEDLHETRAAELSAAQSTLTRIVMAVQALARQPPEAVLSAPEEPLDGARAMMLAQYLVAELRARMVTVKRDLADLATLHGRIDDERNRLAEAHQTLRHHHDALNRLIASNSAARNPDRTTNKPAALAEMTAALNALFNALRRSQDEQRKQAEQLRRTLDQAAPRRAATIPPPPISRPTPELRASKSETAIPHHTDSPDHTHEETASLTPAPEPTPEPVPETAPETTGESVPETTGESAGESVPERAPAPLTADDLKGRLTFPVAGKITTRFATNTTPGVTAKGIAISARPDMPVVATYDGVILYAGPFRGYESIIIIEHGDKIHTLLSGLGRIDVHTGQNVLLGEPVGAMGSDGSGGGQALQRLYVELRYDGVPVDPLPWLNDRRNSVKQ